MPDSSPNPDRLPDCLPDWEAFYRSYRKPGYVPGYEITSKLGGGTFGLVFRARKESIGKDYAIKFLRVEDTEVRRAVLRELDQVQYFAQIDHPNLVQIEDRGEVDGIPFLVMQFAGDDTLQDRLPADGDGDADQRAALVSLFAQACRGVMALHDHSLVHFDIKPANVFLRGDVARVGDYGLSKLVTHSHGSLSMGCGTPYYMAPEILQRRGDHRSDIYSLGVMLYEILCARLPFTGGSEWEVLQKHEKDEPEWPAHLAPHELAVLQRCLQKDPSQRIQTVGELIAGLLPGAAALPRPLPTPPPLPPAKAPSSLRPPPLPPLPPPLSPSAPLQPPPLPATVTGEAANCVPPAAPAAAVKPRKRRSVLNLMPTILVLIALFFVVSGRFGWRESHSRERALARRVAAEQVYLQQQSTPVSLSSRLDAFVKSAQRTARAAERRKRETRLSPLSFREFGAPRDIPEYVHMVERLAEAPTFSAGHARKISQYGRPVFLAAVALLQEYDYGSGSDCRCAANTTALLAQMTGLGGLKQNALGCDPSPSDTCRFRANADAWRRLAEKFAGTDEDFRAMLAAKGRGRSGGG